MPRTLSEFHYATIFIDGRAFASADRLHDELAFKLGLPKGYERNWDALLDGLSSIDDPHSNSCAHWEFGAGKRMVLQVQGFSASDADPAVHSALAQTIADANSRLQKTNRGIRIWIEYVSTRSAGHPDD